MVSLLKVMTFFLLDKDSVEAKMKRLEAQYAAFQVVSLVARYGTEQVIVKTFLTYIQTA